MAKYTALLALGLLVGACANQPLVIPKPTTFQAKARTMTDWSRLSVQTADAIVSNLRTVPDSTSGAHIIDGKPVASNLAGRPLFIRSTDPTVPFNQNFEDLLSLELTRRGETVTRNPAGATVVNYDVTVYAYNHGPGEAHLPGTATLLTGAVIGTAAAAAATPIGGAFAGAAAFDITREVVDILSDRPNSEVALDVEVLGGDRSLYKSISFFYIDDGDVPLYLGAFATKGIPLQTGSALTAPAPTRVVRVSAQ